MKKRFNISAVLDASGVIALVGSAVCLAGSLWFAKAWPAASFLGAFEVCFAVALGCLMGARVVQIAAIIKASPSASSMRAEPVAEPVATLGGGSSGDDISRAA